MSFNKKLLKVIFSSLIIYIFICSVVPVIANSEQRDLYIGDVLELEITTSEFSESQIRDKFKEFEIIDLKRLDKGYLLKIRSFEPGEKEVRLGDKLLKIQVNSTLAQYEREQVFEGKLEVKEAENTVFYQYLFYGLLVFLIIIILIVVWHLFQNKTGKQELLPYQIYENIVKNVDNSEKDFFVSLTFAFKKYIEKAFGCKILGKTSSEIMEEIEDISQLHAFLSRIENWLQTADYYKFTTNTATSEKREQQLQKLNEIIKEIDDLRENEKEG